MLTRKGIFRNARDAVVIILVTAALGELGLRIYNYVNPLPIFYTVRSFYLLIERQAGPFNHCWADHWGVLRP